MPFPATVDCCGGTRLGTLKATLGSLQNLPGADTANDPTVWDTRQQTLRKIALASGVTLTGCCGLETIAQLTALIAVADAGSGIPAGALLDEDGNPILDENGDYIIIE